MLFKRIRKEMIGFNWTHFFGCGEGYDALKKGLKRNMIGSQLFWIR